MLCCQIRKEACWRCCVAAVGIGQLAVDLNRLGRLASAISETQYLENALRTIKTKRRPAKGTQTRLRMFTAF